MGVYARLGAYVSPYPRTDEPASFDPFREPFTSEPEPQEPSVEVISEPAPSTQWVLVEPSEPEPSASEPEPSAFEPSSSQAEAIRAAERTLVTATPVGAGPTAAAYERSDDAGDGGDAGAVAGRPGAGAPGPADGWLLVAAGVVLLLWVVDSQGRR